MSRRATGVGIADLHFGLALYLLRSRIWRGKLTLSHRLFAEDPTLGPSEVVEFVANGTSSDWHVAGQTDMVVGGETAIAELSARRRFILPASYRAGE